MDNPRIGLKFSDGAKTDQGVVMGWAPDCDIVLPRLRGLGRYHLALTFDEKNHLIVRDLGSVYGTRVTFKTETASRVTQADWVVGGVNFVKDKTPILEFVENLQFTLVVPPHDIESRQFIDSVANFRRGTAGIAELAEFLRIRSLPATDLPTPSSRLSTKPSGDPVILRFDELGKGTFGSVTHVYKPQTGEEFALKEPRDKHGFTLSKWKREADIISTIRHVSVFQPVWRTASCDQYADD